MGIWKMEHGNRRCRNIGRGTQHENTEAWVHGSMGNGIYGYMLTVNTA